MKGEKTIFLTGGTGNLGRELIRIFLERTADRLLLLVRPKNSESHEERLERILGKMGIHGEGRQRIRALAGDVTQPRLGLSAQDWKTALEESDEFFHVAALTHLGAEWEEAERANVRGTQQALQLAREAHEKGRLRRFIYFSTAYVAGSYTGIHALEDELPENPRFANHYEATKYVAEKAVREESDRGLPVTIFRPSIVVGDSKNGAVSEFNVIYPFWRLFAHGLLRKLPCRKEHGFNLVPIDFVVESSFLISRMEESVGKAFHLVSQSPPTVEMLLRVKEEFNISSPVELIDPETFTLESLSPIEQSIFSKIQPYIGYLTGSLTFDVKNAAAFLERAQIRFPNTGLEFLKKIVDYAIKAGYILRP